MWKIPDDIPEGGVLIQWHLTPHELGEQISTLSEFIAGRSYRKSTTPFYVQSVRCSPISGSLFWQIVFFWQIVLPNLPNVDATVLI